MARTAVIAGTGLERLSELVVERTHEVSTPYGAPSAAPQLGRLQGAPVIYLARHGHDHALAPHAINYRANLWALHALGARAILAVYTVGAIANLSPGTIVLPRQVIDYTWGREHTFSALGSVRHVDFTEPFSASLRARLLAAARQRAPAQAPPVVDGGVYACMQGPRLETAAEIDRLERDGCTLVGMTGMPEIALARELDLPIAGICLVLNAAAGRGEIDFDTMARIGAAGRSRVLHALAGALEP